MFNFAHTISQSAPNESKSTKELKKLKNKAVLNLKQYCMRCYVALSYVF